MSGRRARLVDGKARKHFSFRDFLIKFILFNCQLETSALVLRSVTSRLIYCLRRDAAPPRVSSAPQTVEGPDLTVNTACGLTLPNPFVIGSGPPGTNYTARRRPSLQPPGAAGSAVTRRRRGSQVMKKAFDEGWGGVICKTLSLDSSMVVNVTPRYAKMMVPGSRDVLGWSNIELISDRSFETMLAELKQLKAEYPDRILIASIMEEYSRGAWEEIIGRCEAAGVDGFEINFSCPHGMPERRMGMAMGQDCELLTEVCGWISGAATKPVWAKVRPPAWGVRPCVGSQCLGRALTRFVWDPQMTPNITDITHPARAALAAGCEGVAAINTITARRPAAPRGQPPSPVRRCFSVLHLSLAAPARLIARTARGLPAAAVRDGGQHGQPAPGAVRGGLLHTSGLLLPGSETHRAGQGDGHLPHDRRRVRRRPLRQRHRWRGVRPRRGGVHPSGVQHRAGLHRRHGARISACAATMWRAAGLYGAPPLRLDRRVPRPQPAVLHDAQ